MRDLNNLNKENDSKMDYKVGDTVYTVRNYMVGRYEVVEVIRKTTNDGTKVSYTLQDPLGRKIPSDGGKSDIKIFKTMKKAKACALDEWKKIDSTMRTQLNEMSDEALDKEIEKQKQHIEAKKKAQMEAQMAEQHKKTKAFIK